MEISIVECPLCQSKVNTYKNGRMKVHYFDRYDMCMGTGYRISEVPNVPGLRKQSRNLCDCPRCV